MSYRLRYSLSAESGHFTKEEITGAGDDYGGADALVVISIIRPDDGSYSLAVVSKDGDEHGGPLSTAELFKAWTTFGMWLYRNHGSELYPRSVALLNTFFEGVREFMGE